MKVFLNEISGIDDAITSMFMSKRTWNREMEQNIRETCKAVLERNGALKSLESLKSEGCINELDRFTDWLDTLIKWGRKHITLLRFVDMSVTVEGMHRAGQDDWDSHAKRFNNRILRSSTRLAEFGYERSNWYQDKILPTDLALKHLNLNIPETMEVDGVRYVKSVNGYIREDLKDSSDVKRGLYMLSIPSNFIFKVDLTEWAHVYKERNKDSRANPEVKQCCESIADQLEAFHKQFNRELFSKIKN